MNTGNVLRWLVTGGVLAGGVYWYVSTPSEEAKKREQICRDWGFTDNANLARCRQSEKDESAVIAPKMQQAAMKDVLEFNEQVAANETNKTSAKESDYVPMNISDLSKAIGGTLQLTPTDAPFPLNRKQVKLSGRIITDTPDPSTNDNGSSWRPQTYELWADMPKNSSGMPETVELDIESLNRDERKLIQSECDIISFTQCNAVILGHVGRIGSDSSPLQDRGVIVDQLDMKPIDVKSYRMA